ncbi:unnamed protein product [Alternaria burnsii]|nr:unnamed protein product [Alternaria burnsii]
MDPLHVATAALSFTEFATEIITSVESMKEVIAVRTRVVPKPSVSAQIWKDIAKVISHSETDVAFGAPNLVAESRTQEKTTCESTIGSSTDDLSMPTLWFPELRHSHCGKRQLLESYFKRQSSRTTSSHTIWIDASCIDRDSMKGVYYLLVENGQIHPNTSIVVRSLEGGVSWRRNAVVLDSMDRFKLAYQRQLAHAPVDQPLKSDLINSILSWLNIDTYKEWMWYREHVKFKSRTPASSFAYMAPNSWRQEDEVPPNFRTPPTNTLPNTVFSDFVSGHEDEVTPTFRTPPANTSPYTVFWDFDLYGYEEPVIPTFRSRPLFYGLHPVRLGIG